MKRPAKSAFPPPPGVVELSPLDPRATVCGVCGRGWDDSVASAWTPAPAGRCPFEYLHPKSEEPDPWANDAIQFPRFIAEAEEAGAFTPEVVAEMAVSMDLDPAQVLELVERASNRWDAIKASV